MLARITNLILLSFLLALAWGCSSDNKPGQSRQSRTVPVRVATVKVEPVEQALNVIGHVEPSASVQITAQVGGQLMESWVRPGREVKAGAVLFKIDPRSFQAKLNQAEASLKREQSQLKKARQDLERYRLLASKDFLSQQQYEQSMTEVESLEATIAESQAIRENAVLELGHTTVTAPISGRVGEVLVDPGNNVRANESVLLVINTIKPSDVRFSVPERFLPELKRRVKEGKVAVNVLPEGDRGQPIVGELYIIDNEVDRSTGTIAMRARFPNTEERLWPGQFVRVNIVMDALNDALVIPQTAVLEGLYGRYVYLLRPDSTVESREITSEHMRDGRSIVLAGLEAGETVVVDGQLNLAPGSRVEVIGNPSSNTAQPAENATPEPDSPAAATGAGQAEEKSASAASQPDASKGPSSTAQGS